MAIAHSPANVSSPRGMGSPRYGRSSNAPSSIASRIWRRRGSPMWARPGGGRRHRCRSVACVPVPRPECRRRAARRAGMVQPSPVRRLLATVRTAVHDGSLPIAAAGYRRGRWRRSRVAGRGAYVRGRRTGSKAGHHSTAADAGSTAGRRTGVDRSRTRPAVARSPRPDARRRHRLTIDLDPAAEPVTITADATGRGRASADVTAVGPVSHVRRPPARATRRRWGSCG